MKAGRRRVLFVRAQAAAPATPVAVRMPAVPVMFVKAITPAPVSLEPLPDPDQGIEFDFGKPMTGHMFDLIAKGLHEGAISVEDAARASDAWVCYKPLPHDLIELVVALAR